jgi:hypothetical protein
MPVQWLKAKYRKPKPVGKYKSSLTGDSTKRRPNKHKMSDKRKLEIKAEQPLVTMVLLPSGKRRFVREKRND